MRDTHPVRRILLIWLSPPGICAPTNRTPSIASIGAARVSWCCPVERAKPLSVSVRWPPQRRQRSSLSPTPSQLDSGAMNCSRARCSPRRTSESTRARRRRDGRGRSRRTTSSLPSGRASMPTSHCWTRSTGVLLSTTKCTCCRRRSLSSPPSCRLDDVSGSPRHSYARMDVRAMCFRLSARNDSMHRGGTSKRRVLFHRQPVTRCGLISPSRNASGTRHLATMSATGWRRQPRRNLGSYACLWRGIRVNKFWSSGNTWTRSMRLPRPSVLQSLRAQHQLMSVNDSSRSFAPDKHLCSLSRRSQIFRLTCRRRVLLSRCPVPSAPARRRPSGWDDCSGLNSPGAVPPSTLLSRATLPIRSLLKIDNDSSPSRDTAIPSWMPRPSRESVAKVAERSQQISSKLLDDGIMNDGPNILIVDDETNIRDLLLTSLRFAGFSAHAVANGAQAISAVLEQEPDLIVLDVMLPDMTGFGVEKRLRTSGFSAPILFLTAKDDTEDKITGLTVGGDDYVTKPFSLDEIIARINVILRRTLSTDRDALLQVGDISLDQDTHEVYVGETLIELSPTEFKLLRYLLLNPNRVLSKAQILDPVWEYDFNGDAGIVESYVSYLRRKIDPHTVESPIHTKRGFGYMFKPARA